VGITQASILMYEAVIPDNDSVVCCSVAVFS